MEKAMIRTLLEKYWQAETTVEEEQTLAAYFQGPDIDPELQPYRDLFAYFEEELQVKPAPGFDARILQRLGIANTAPATAANTAPATAADTAPAPAAGTAPALAADTAPKIPLRTFRLGFLSAAAAIAALVIGLFLLTPPPQQPVLTKTTASKQIKDTYDDPQQALAAVRHALLIASAHLNEGRQQLTGARKY